LRILVVDDNHDAATSMSMRRIDDKLALARSAGLRTVAA
jgi:hypothetical protein